VVVAPSVPFRPTACWLTLHLKCAARCLTLGTSFWSLKIDRREFLSISVANMENIHFLLSLHHPVDHTINIWFVAIKQVPKVLALGCCWTTLKDVLQGANGFFEPAALDKSIARRLRVDPFVSDTNSSVVFEASHAGLMNLG
jgi:hypothetical protein